MNFEEEISSILLNEENDSDKFTHHFQQLEEKMKGVFLIMKQKHKKEIERINQIHEKDNQEIEEKLKFVLRK
jgi:hypothetical protein